MARRAARRGPAQGRGARAQACRPRPPRVRRRYRGNGGRRGATQHPACGDPLPDALRGGVPPSRRARLPRPLDRPPYDLRGLSGAAPGARGAVFELGDLTSAECGVRSAECGVEGAGSIPSASRWPRRSRDPLRIPHSALRTRMTAGLLIFALTYVLIAVQRLPFVHLNRPAASLVGAVAMVVFGVLSLPDAYAAVDFDVLVFLLGMMLIVGYLEVGKFFEWAAEWVLQRARTPERLLLGVVVGGGLLSAFFVNDTICLVVTPVLLAALGPMRVRPNPYLIGLAMGANVGSVLSVTGNPQNMLVGIWSRATFGGFLVHMLPVALGGLALTYGYLRWVAAARRDRRRRAHGARGTARSGIRDRAGRLEPPAVFWVAVRGDARLRAGGRRRVDRPARLGSGRE